MGFVAIAADNPGLVHQRRVVGNCIANFPLEGPPVRERGTTDAVRRHLRTERGDLVGEPAAELVDEPLPPFGQCCSDTFRWEGRSRCRGRRSGTELYQGDALDFWRVLRADRKNGRLALYAEMKLPGEAFLEFTVEETFDGRKRFYQKATFRPQGVWGRLYWYLMMPAHIFIFKGMALNIINYQQKQKR